MKDEKTIMGLISNEKNNLQNMLKSIKSIEKLQHDPLDNLYKIKQEVVKIENKMVYNKFRGKTVTESEIHEFVIAETPYIYRKSILKQLETHKPSRIIEVTNRKKKFSYPEGCHITFSR